MHFKNLHSFHQSLSNLHRSYIFSFESRERLDRPRCRVAYGMVEYLAGRRRAAALPLPRIGFGGLAEQGEVILGSDLPYRPGRKDDENRKLLQEIAMRDPRPTWTAWAREQLALLGRRVGDYEELSYRSMKRTTQNGGRMSTGLMDISMLFHWPSSM